MKIQKRYIGLILVWLLWAFPALGQVRTFEFPNGEQPVKGSFEFTPKTTDNLGIVLQTKNGVYEFDCSNIKINEQGHIYLELKNFQSTGTTDYVAAYFNIQKWNEVSGALMGACLVPDSPQRLYFTPTKNGSGTVKITYKVYLGQCNVGTQKLDNQEFTFSYKIFGFKTPSANPEPPKNITHDPPERRAPITTVVTPSAPTPKVSRLPEVQTACVYRDFIQKHKGTEIGNRAEIILEKLINISDIQYQKIETGEKTHLKLQFSNIVQPQVDTIFGSTIEKLDTAQFACSGQLIILGVTNLDNLYIAISDKGKPAGKDRLEIKFGNIFTVKTIHFDTDSIILLFNKGKLPYQITFYDAAGRAVIKPISGITDSVWTFSMKQLTENKIFGDIRLEVNDSGNGLFISPYLNLEPKAQNWYWLFLLIFPVILYFLNNRRQRRIHEKYQRLKEEKNAEAANSPTPEEASPAQNESDVPAKPEAPIIAGKSGGMTILSRRASPSAEVTILLENAVAPFQLNEQEYAVLGMQSHWDDSAVKTIYLHRSSIGDIDSFIRTHKNDFLDEKENSVPEIGGLLLGNAFQLQTGGPYLVGIDKFIQITPESHDKFQLEFSTQSLAYELGIVQDDFPNLTVVGWFHTHPGHGLFLSKPDLAIQDGFFDKPYQFAMEIDTLSEDLDTGFFTRRHSGQINNAAFLRTGAKWFVWAEIEKITRKRT